MRKHATCILVWEWMVAHEDALPQGYAIKKPTTDAQRAERLLRRQFNYLQSIKDEHPPALRALFEQIEGVPHILLISPHAIKCWSGLVKMKRSYPNI